MTWPGRSLRLSLPPHPQQRIGWIAAAGPSVLVAAPLAGMPFQIEELLRVFDQTLRTDARPLAVAGYVADRLDTFLDHGNFRPLGRYADVLMHGFVYEAGEATGMSPHVFLGAVRVGMVALVAVLAVRMVEALGRSAHIPIGGAAASLVSLILSAAIIANGSLGALGPFPQTAIGAVALVLGTALCTARDRDLSRRPVRWHEYASMALLGGAAAAFYDLAYLAPVVAGVFAAARGIAGGEPLRGVVRLAAARRWAALCCGFAAVFLPSRFEIARRCTGEDCYSGSDISFSSDALGATSSRLLTGFPAVGWMHNADAASASGLDRGLGDMAANALLAALLVGVAVLAVRAARPALSSRTGPAAHEAPSSGFAAAPPDGRRFAAALVAVGASVALGSAALAGMSRAVQEQFDREHGYLRLGDGWRETLLTQVGWTLLLAGLLVLVLQRPRRPSVRAATHLAAALLLAACSAFTLLSNWRFASLERSDPSTVTRGLISTDSVRGGDEWDADTTRCALLQAYSDNSPGSSWPVDTAESLNRLMIDRHGAPYCDPGRFPGGDGVLAERDWLRE